MTGSNSRIESFELQAFIGEIRAIVSAQTNESTDSARESVLAVMRTAFEHPARVAAALPDYDEDDVILFEDDTVSIWFCRFKPGVHVPPHDHQMSAFIGVYDGAELNSFYERGEMGLNKIRETWVRPGDVLTIAADDIHSVTTTGTDPSCALHVYLGELTKVERSLFDWDSGESVEFTQASYDKMVRAS